MNNIIEQLKQLQPQIFETNVSKGFWKKESDENKGERAMLIITELSEAVEAHRKGKIADAIHFKGALEADDIKEEDMSYYVDMCFKQFIKDSIEDEMADVVIRALDYCSGFDLPIMEREFRKNSTGNFAEDILALTELCAKAHRGNTPGKDWGCFLTAVIEFCKWYNIDLYQHVQWKLHWNKTRPQQHGKKY